MSDKQISNHILHTSATMTGVCLTVISLVKLIEGTHNISTLIDNLMAVDSLIFLVSCFLSYISLRASQGEAFEKCADILFLGGLSLMVLASFGLAWEIGRL